MSDPSDRRPDAPKDPGEADQGQRGDDAHTSGTAASPAPPRPFDAADDLLAAAEDLAGSSEEGWRSRSSTVRRPRRVVRGNPTSGLLDDTEEPERVRVRSSAEEVRAGGGPSPSEDPSSIEDATDSPMLDATGQVIRPPAADEQAVVDGRTGPTPGGPDDKGSTRAEVAASREASATRDAAVLDVSVFLVDAVRSYLAGIDEFGTDHDVTRDRRDRLRRTLELWDRE